MHQNNNNGYISGNCDQNKQSAFRKCMMNLVRGSMRALTLFFYFSIFRYFSFTMNRSTMQVESKQVKLSLGMNVTVEIKTGKRRVIEYFLNPLLRGIKETARER